MEREELIEMLEKDVDMKSRMALNDMDDILRTLNNYVHSLEVLRASYLESDCTNQVKADSFISTYRELMSKRIDIECLSDRVAMLRMGSRILGLVD